jgi:hypothetical protein
VDIFRLELVYVSKTDDELLALALERKSLEPAAQSVLWAELRRRKLTHPRLLHPSASTEIGGQNLAFNLSAKVGAVVMLVAYGALGLTLAIAVAREHQFFKLVLVFMLFWGPIFAVIAWATHRALRNRHDKSGRN